MNKLITALLIGGLSLGGMAIASADSDHYRKGEHHGKYCDKGKGRMSRIERMTSELGLNETQVKQMRDIEAKYQPKMQALRDQLKANRQKLRDAKHADNIDLGTVKKLARQQADLKVDKTVLRAEMRIDMNKVLTNEQRAKMKEMYQNRGERYRHHGHEKYNS